MSKKNDKTLNPIVKNNMKERIKEKAEQEKLNLEKEQDVAQNLDQEESSEETNIDPTADAQTDKLDNPNYVDESEKIGSNDKGFENTEPDNKSSRIIHENTKVLVKEDSPRTQDKSGSKKKKKGIFSNLGLKLIALLAAFVLWFIVMNIEDGVVTRTVLDIPVEMLNGDTILENGYLYNVTDGETVSVIVKGPSSIVENLEVDNFRATADLSKLSVTNSTTVKVELNASVQSSKAKKVTITPINQYVSLSIEEEVEKSIPVRVITSGTVQEGYALGNPVPTPNMVTVSGPESVLSNIVEARAVVDVTGAEGDIEKTVKIGCIDGYGVAIEKDNLTLSENQATINIPVYPTKEIPINVSTAGSVREGYGIRSVNYEPTSIVIAGEAEALKNVDSINITGVLVTDAAENIERNIDIMEYLPADTIIADSSYSEIAVNVVIEAAVEQEVSFSKDDINIIDVDNAYSYEIEEPDMVKVKVKGFADEIADVGVNDLNPRISVAALREGIYELEVGLDSSEKYTIKDGYKVKVRVSKKND